MDIVFNILLFFHVTVCLLMVLLVLMQRPKQEGLGAAFASGMMSESFGAQATDVLQQTTRYLAILFFVLSISMASIKARENRARYATGTEPPPAAEVSTSPSAETPASVVPVPDPAKPAADAAKPDADAAKPAADAAKPAADAAKPAADAAKPAADAAKPAADAAKPAADAAKPAADAAKPAADAPKPAAKAKDKGEVPAPK